MTVRGLASAFRRIAAVLVVALGFVVVAAPVAAADSGRPTNYLSTIESITPQPKGVDIKIVANDAFVSVSAVRGTEVDIPGYDGEPYLRIRADGTVQENERSPSRTLNQSMTGSALPADADSRAEPRWTTIGTDGQVAWHDHRTHWMLDEPPTVGRDGVIQDWELPLTVDGTKVMVNGTLRYEGNVVPWGLFVAAAVAVLTWLGCRWEARRRSGRAPSRVIVAPALTALASLIAGGLWFAERAIAPPGAPPSLIPLLLAVGALVASVAAVVRPAGSTTTGSVTTLFAAVALLTGWAVVRLTVWWKPLLPTAAPDWVDRAGTAVVVGVVLGVAVALLQASRRPAAAPSAEPA